MSAVNLLPREDPSAPQAAGVATQLALVSPFVVASLVVAGFLLASSKVNDNARRCRRSQQELAALPAPGHSRGRSRRSQPSASQRISAFRRYSCAAVARRLGSHPARDLRRASRGRVADDAVRPDPETPTTVAAASGRADVDDAAPTTTTTTTTTAPRRRAAGAGRPRRRRGR